MPFRHPDQILYAVYPGLKTLDGDRPTRGDQYFDVLLLGGSALHKDWGHVEPALREQLALSGRRSARIYNLAEPGHTSRDSWLKYAAISEARFDLVLIYDGLNEVRANNAPPEIFRDDYGHYAWYEIVNSLAPYHGTASFALPYTLRRLAIGVRQTVNRGRYVPVHRPREDWVRYGRSPRSNAALRRNLNAILDLAERRGDSVLLMTVATYVPSNYSLAAFREKRLNYGLHLSPIELWGDRDNVIATVAAHNTVLRDLAAQHSGVLFVDQAKQLAGAPLYFNDVCHFTMAGSSKFAGNIVSALAGRTETRH